MYELQLCILVVQFDELKMHILPCNQIHSQDMEYFYHLKNSLMPICSHFVPTFYPRQPLICLQTPLIFLKHFIYMESYNIQFLCLASFIQRKVFQVHSYHSMRPTLCQSHRLSIISSFLLLNSIPLHGYTTFCLSSHQLMDIWIIFVHVCSVLSNSLRPHGLHPTRLLCP